MTTIQDNNDLLAYLIKHADSGAKNWFGFQQQKVAGIALAYDIAKHHADKMSPNDIVDFVIDLNNAVYLKMIKVNNAGSYSQG